MGNPPISPNHQGREFILEYTHELLGSISQKRFQPQHSWPKGVSTDELLQWISEWGSWTSSISVTWELAGNAKSQAPSQAD